MLPNHLFVGCEGELCDARKGCIAIREGYARHYAAIERGGQLVACLRAGAYTSIGGYPLYFVTGDGQALSFETVTKHIRKVVYAVRHQRDNGWRVVGCLVNYGEELLDAYSV